MSGTEQAMTCHQDLSDAQRLGRLLHPGACESICEGIENEAPHTTPGADTLVHCEGPAAYFIRKPSVQHNH